MKKIIVYIVTLFAASSVSAQPWMQDMGNNPVKLQDVVAYYKAHPAPADDGKDKDEMDEKGDFHFDRWMWYWKDHTDENGYLVSPVKTWQEWDAYMQKENSAARLSKTNGTRSSWTFQGPSGSAGGYYGVGRINTVAFHPTDSNTIWAGSAGGGAWASSDNGTTWRSVAGNLPVLGVSSIAFNPLNGNTVYLATGDGDGGDTYTMGVFKTTDGGNTWSATGLTFASNALAQIPSIIINPSDSNTILAATTSGIYRSLNGGISFTNVYAGGFKQVLYDPHDTNVVYATGNHGGSYNQIYRSADGGATWLAVTSFMAVTRVTLAVTKANPGIVKAIAAATANFGLIGVYSSSDTGKTFSMIFDGTANNCANNILGFDFRLPSSGCTGQGWYTLSLAMSPNDTTSLYAGGVNTWGSRDGGRTWHIVNQWYTSLPNIATLHADKHFLGFNPIAPAHLYEGNDGGIYTTTTPNSLIWKDITTGLGITQYYRNAVSNVASYTLGGAQDNGCMAVAGGQVLAQNVLGGDGMQVQMDYTDPNVFYAESQYGDLNVTFNGGASMTNISNNIPGRPTGSWITPYVLNPVAPNIVYAGYDQLYLSQDQGSSWVSISPTFSTGNTIDRVVVPIFNSDYIYVLVNNIIHYTTNNGTSWSTFTSNLSGNISDIVVDPKNEKILWVTYSGYATNKVAKHSLITNTWTVVNGQLPNIPVNCMAIDSSNGMMYIGADVGIYYYDTATVKWTLYNTGLPNVKIDDININYTAGELWAATFGRGMWKTPKYDTVINLGVSVIPYAQNVITISPDPNYGQFTVTTSDLAFVDKKVTSRLISNSGKTVWNNTTVWTNGVMPVNAKGMHPGVYIFEAISGNAVARTRVVIY